MRKDEDVYYIDWDAKHCPANSIWPKRLWTPWLVECNQPFIIHRMERRTVSKESRIWYKGLLFKGNGKSRMSFVSI